MDWSADAELVQPVPERRVLRACRLGEGPLAQLEVWIRAPSRLLAQCRGERVGVGGGRHRVRPRLDAGQLGRDGPAPEAGVLEDAVGQAGVVEGLDLER